MPSPPPPSSEFGFDMDSGWPSNEIPNLTREARLVTTLPPALATVMTTHKELILSVLSRQIGLIKSRPQDLGYAEVTIYDRALLELTSDGNRIDDPSALLFWCQYYLGIDDVRAPKDTPKFLQEMMAVPIVINQAIETQSLHRLSGTTIKAESEELPDPIVFSNKSIDPKLKRLFDVYNQARTEYLSVAEQNDQKTITAAKFLRDTAENALSILKDTYIDASVLQELVQTCDKAKIAVVELSGGKKRKFDGPQQEQVGESISKRSFEVRRGNGRGRGGRRGREHSGIPYGYTREVDSYYPY